MFVTFTSDFYILIFKNVLELRHEGRSTAGASVRNYSHDVMGWLHHV